MRGACGPAANLQIGGGSLQPLTYYVVGWQNGADFFISREEAFMVHCIHPHSVAVSVLSIARPDATSRCRYCRQVRKLVRFPCWRLLYEL